MSAEAVAEIIVSGVKHFVNAPLLEQLLNGTQPFKGEILMMQGMDMGTDTPAAGVATGAPQKVVNTPETVEAAKATDPDADCEPINKNFGGQAAESGGAYGDCAGLVGQNTEALERGVKAGLITQETVDKISNPNLKAAYQAAVDGDNRQGIINNLARYYDQAESDHFRGEDFTGTREGRDDSTILFPGDKVRIDSEGTWLVRAGTGEKIPLMDECGEPIKRTVDMSDTIPCHDKDMTPPAKPAEPAPAPRVDTPPPPSAPVETPPVKVAPPAPVETPPASVEAPFEDRTGKFVMVCDTPNTPPIPALYFNSVEDARWAIEHGIVPKGTIVLVPDGAEDGVGYLHRMNPDGTVEAKPFEMVKKITLPDGKIVERHYQILDSHNEVNKFLYSGNAYGYSGMPQNYDPATGKFGNYDSKGVFHPLPPEEAAQNIQRYFDEKVLRAADSGLNETQITALKNEQLPAIFNDPNATDQQCTDAILKELGIDPRTNPNAANSVYGLVRVIRGSEVGRDYLPLVRATGENTVWDAVKEATLNGARAVQAGASR